MTSEEYIVILEHKQERHREVRLEKEERKADLEITKNQNAK